MKLPNIALHGSHNGSITVEHKGDIVVIIELERFLNSKNIGLSRYLPAKSKEVVIQNILDYIHNQYGFEKFDTCFHQSSDDPQTGVKYYEQIPAKKYISCLHHESHAYTAFYQSQYDKGLIISFDGGGNDGYSNVYVAEDRKTIKRIQTSNMDLGFPYMSFAHFLKDINREAHIGLGNLVYAGKIMGLCSYGNVREDWLKAFREYYYSKPINSTFSGLISDLFKSIGLPHGETIRLEGQIAYDIAATSQRVFEDIVFEFLEPFLQEFPDYPLLVTGGCGLNILLNTRLKKELGRDIFVPVNPSDCGLSAGMILGHLKPDDPVDLTYKGIHPLDQDCLPMYIEERNDVRKTSIGEIAQLLANGKIIGVVRGGAEHGPRALGNRSILCNSAFPNMKNILNAKVKNREWYRPFAPVCKLEDINKYFNQDFETRWMSFCPTVKSEWVDRLRSITHTDNTARVQTVTREQNRWLYDLISEFEKHTGVGVLLNTSYNIAGKPIVPTYRDALYLLDNSSMDFAVLNDYIFK